jgi:uncharacterized membrane protein YhdT
MNDQSKKAPRKRLRKTIVTMAISIPGIAFVLVYFLLLTLRGPNNVLEKDVALAAYSAQIQLLGVFASLPPLLFIVREKVKPEPSMGGIKLAVFYASGMILSSMIGMASGFLGILYQWFAISAVGFPFIFVILDGDILLIYVLGTAGFFNRSLSWAEWSFE